MMRFYLVALVLLFSTASVAEAATKRYAVIVAHTKDLRGKLTPLEYADDDGARYYELFSQIADRTLIYTVLDKSSQRLHPKVAKKAEAPRKKNIIKGLEATFARAQQDIDQGHKVDFYFLLIGHGEVGSGGEGYVSLLDAPFTRSDLFYKVLARSPATTNHVIIDACNSYFLVHRRGGDDSGPSRKDALKSFLAKEDLSKYPNTGVLLSTSSEKESHEWSAYGAGVFSHQLRSALSGGADVNGDGRIAYSEVEAFVAAANARVDDPKARIEVFSKAPAVDLSRPLVALKDAKFAHYLRIPKGTGRHLYLEDARGVRFADVHLSGKRAAVLGLVPSTYYYVRTADSKKEMRVDLSKAGRIDVRLKKLRRATIARRGAVAEAFRLHLYAEPFGPGFYKGFVANTGSVSVNLKAAGWLPGTVDAGFVDAELSRLNDQAKADGGLRTRLKKIAPDLMRVLEQGRYKEAASLLAEAEGTGGE